MYSNDVIVEYDHIDYDFFKVSTYNINRINLVYKIFYQLKVACVNVLNSVYLQLICFLRGFLI